MPEGENGVSNELQAALATMRQQVMSELPNRVDVVSSSTLIGEVARALRPVADRRAQPVNFVEPVSPRLESPELTTEAPELPGDLLAAVEQLTQAELPTLTPSMLLQVLGPAPMRPPAREAEFGYLTHVRVPGIGHILEGQEANGDDRPTIGTKPPMDKDNPAIPPQPDKKQHPERTTVNGKGELEGLAKDVPEILKCGDELHIVTRKPFTCDVVVWTEFACSDNEIFDCDTDAEYWASRKFPDRVGTNPDEFASILRKLSDYSRITDQELAVLKAWLGACDCVQEILRNERGTIKDVNGEVVTQKDAQGRESKDKQGKPIPIPDIDKALAGEFDCESPCVPQWKVWCGYAEFEETNRWCETAYDEDHPVEDDPDCLMFDAKYKHKYAIKVRITGWFDIHWRMTCVKIQDTPEGQDLIEKGAITPDGTPIGHYRPPWAEPPPEQPHGPPVGCCCEVVSVKITSIEQCRFRGDLWGHVFNVRIAYRWISDTQEDCKLEWWEWSDNFPPWYTSRYGIKNGQWVDIADRIENSGVFDPWKSPSKRPIPNTPEECDGQIHYLDLKDIPALGTDASKPENQHRTLWIKIRATGCNNSEDAACFVQHLNQTAGGEKYDVEAYAYECIDTMSPLDGSEGKLVGPPDIGDEDKMHRTGYSDAAPAVECTLF